MLVDNDYYGHNSMPVFMEETEEILAYLKGLSYDELKKLYRASDKLTQLNFQRLKSMDLYRDLTSAILSFEGLQYKYMGARVFTVDELAYVQEHLRIMSAFYGILKPLDGLVPHRLEMQARPRDWKYKNFYDFWNSKLAESIFSETDTILDLASKEYSRPISKYLNDNISMVEVVFGELIDGKVIEKGTYAKMARGEMVRFMAENQIKDLEGIKDFNRHGYAFREEYSNKEKYVFIKEG